MDLGRGHRLSDTERQGAALPPGGSQLQVSMTHDGDSLVLSVSGELDLASSPVLEEAIIDCRRLGQPLVFDLSAVTFVDVVGIKPITGSCEEGDARLRAGSPCVRRLLHLIEEVSPISTDAWWLDGGEPDRS